MERWYWQICQNALEIKGITLATERGNSEIWTEKKKKRKEEKKLLPSEEPSHCKYAPVKLIGLLWKCQASLC